MIIHYFSLFSGFVGLLFPPCGASRALRCVCVQVRALKVALLFCHTLHLSAVRASAYGLSLQKDSLHFLTYGSWLLREPKQNLPAFLRARPGAGMAVCSISKSNHEVSLDSGKGKIDSIF